MKPNSFSQSIRDLSPQQIQRLLQDPLIVEKLSDRVYELLRDDLRQQQERRQGYGRKH